MNDLLTDEEEKIFDRKMSVLAYITFKFKDKKMSELLEVSRHCINRYRMEFINNGWTISEGSTRNQVTRLTELGESILESYDGIIY